MFPREIPKPPVSGDCSMRRPELYYLTRIGIAAPRRVNQCRQMTFRVFRRDSSGSIEMNSASHEGPLIQPRLKRLGVVLVLLCVYAASVASLFSETPTSTVSGTSTTVGVPSLTLAEMQKRVAAASAVAPPWNGPRTGPEGQTGKNIAIITEDLRNGGILGVAQGIYEAATVMKWTVKVFDAAGTPAGRNHAAADALASGPDGVILVGADAEAMQSQLLPFAKRGVPLVGWHVGPKPGPLRDSPVAMNVSTDPVEVGQVTAMAAVVAAKGHAGVVIFTDPTFEIAMTKANAMANVIRAFQGCTLLEMRTTPISRSADEIPGITRELLSHYGDRWNCALAINDIYFDYAVPELTKVGRPADSLNFLSAGDGSSAAFMRIQVKLFQIGTVAEPLNLHGWQLVDELNRLLAHQPVSGYITPVHLVTPSNVSLDGGRHFQFDPSNGYREIYRHIWKR